jgi:hypothetical protein
MSPVELVAGSKIARMSGCGSAPEGTNRQWWVQDARRHTLCLTWELPPRVILRHHGRLSRWMKNST